MISDFYLSCNCLYPHFCLFVLQTTTTTTTTTTITATATTATATATTATTATTTTATTTATTTTFCVYSPNNWNSLPLHIRSSDSLVTFQSRLKSHLFSSAYHV